MPQSLANVLVHTVFSTMDRKPIIPAGIRTDLHAYIGGTLRNINCQPVQVGGTSDHVHVLFRLARNTSLADALEKVKASSSKWIKAKEGVSGDFKWQAGYGAFSVSPEHEAQMSNYIQNQESHHQKRSFQDELKELLIEAGLEFDERYLWD